MFGTATVQTLPLDPVPARDRFGSLDHDVLAGGGGVGDAPQVAEPAAPGPDPFAVLPAVDDDGVPGLGELGGPVDGAERSVLGAVGWSDPVVATWNSNGILFVDLSHVCEVAGLPAEPERW